MENNKGNVMLSARATENRYKVLKDLRTNFNLYGIWIFFVYVVYVIISSLFIRLFENNGTFLYSVYSTISNTTIGFANIEHPSNGGKVIACINAIIGLLFFGAIVGLIALSFVEQKSKDEERNKIAEELRKLINKHISIKDIIEILLKMSYIDKSLLMILL